MVQLTYVRLVLCAIAFVLLLLSEEGVVAKLYLPTTPATLSFASGGSTYLPNGVDTPHVIYRPQHTRNSNRLRFCVKYIKTSVAQGDTYKATIIDTTCESDSSTTTCSDATTLELPEGNTCLGVTTFRHNEPDDSRILSASLSRVLPQGDKSESTVYDPCHNMTVDMFVCGDATCTISNQQSIQRVVRSVDLFPKTVGVDQKCTDPANFFSPTYRYKVTLEVGIGYSFDSSDQGPVGVVTPNFVSSFQGSEFQFPYAFVRSELETYSGFTNDRVKKKELSFFICKDSACTDYEISSVALTHIGNNRVSSFMKCASGSRDSSGADLAPFDIIVASASEIYVSFLNLTYTTDTDGKEISDTMLLTKCSLAGTSMSCEIPMVVAQVFNCIARPAIAYNQQDGSVYAAYTHTIDEASTMHRRVTRCSWSTQTCTLLSGYGLDRKTSTPFANEVYGHLAISSAANELRLYGERSLLTCRIDDNCEQMDYGAYDLSYQPIFTDGTFSDKPECITAAYELDPTNYDPSGPDEGVPVSQEACGFPLDLKSGWFGESPGHATPTYLVASSTGASGAAITKETEQQYLKSSSTTLPIVAGGAAGGAVLLIAIIAVVFFKRRSHQENARWHVPDSFYDIFLSYRVSSDSDFVTVFEKDLQLSKANQIGPLRRKAKIFLDKEAMKGGEDWRQQFVEALSSSQTLIPIITCDEDTTPSTGSVGQMMSLDLDSRCDNVLLELELGLELLANPRGSIQRIFPIMYGSSARAKNGTESYTPFPMGSVDNLPDVIAYETKTQCREVLKQLGLSPSEDFEMRTVRGVVKAILQAHGRDMSAIGSSTRAKQFIAGDVLEVVDAVFTESRSLTLNEVVAGENSSEKSAKTQPKSAWTTAKPEDV